MQYRRFGKTGYRMPVFSCGGMRYQQSWKTGDPVSDESQRNLEACIRRSVEIGINHIETARGYGTSEYQLGKILPKFPRASLLIQTKVGPMDSVEKFRKTFEQSMSLLGVEYLDVFSFHGINDEQTLQWTLECYDTAAQWKREGRIRDIGFSTHGSTDIIVRTIETGLFDHVNLHWYYIFQDNWRGIEAATARDMGVFIISPNDKGGMLYTPSAKLVELCRPLHPMVFNGLFCLSHPEVHTLSCGVSRPSDFDVHLETVRLLDRASDVLPPIMRRLEDEMARVMGEDWAASWDEGLPEWDDIPGKINVRWILRLRNLALAYDLVEYGKMRYNLLGSGGNWFPGSKADGLEALDLAPALANSPFADRIPAALAEAHALLSGEKRKRLQEA